MNHNVKKFILTEEGLDQLKAECEELIKSKRPQIVRRIKRAREFGDLSENSEYDAAKEEQSLIEARISQLEDVILHAQIAQQVKKTDFVVIGSTVIVESDGQVEEFSIVGSMEADPAMKKISNESPVGFALLGAKVGELVDVITPIIRAKYKILSIK
ncbi:transcription elongation factor GreA [Candidatus Curtissbacteria bacterium RIFCSPLOWO2_01_FULL_39_62]|uniref:Transcription elongation factor GreA n=2 Tax=Candidatus Curtissiibacteriota TaxID=1752717 RepID=A0A1F5G735_9BACT|nr:MAG: transcription elongation factor GreA [Candidatus Curtissbacteria bacterium RIFCSPHIGHO2_01_FULL_39_57]OGD87651.1 MAG: transcription elongation factor GreA [Candidatus Curtissbacteria bacterium RIFCSPHIGHO2_02_FULL_40_16b]OGD90133.1 MAG: transcription elongation factor GreA [Candidatus Curtissbacteria bacterium RIFCSPHIGHO2_12_FULL_38_37]OGE00446.1 MAG: transcription elongation factor GreA [Candidatus Curtissbacteria bacterium RIFCSPLOWO2_01_FULL_39_62]OGE01030.1 MAG: transcription elong